MDFPCSLLMKAILPLRHFKVTDKVIVLQLLDYSTSEIRGVKLRRCLYIAFLLKAERQISMLRQPSRQAEIQMCYIFPPHAISLLHTGHLPSRLPLQIKNTQETPFSTVKQILHVKEQPPKS